MKQLISLLLALTMVVCLAACGAKVDAPEEPVSFQVIVTDLEGNETTFTYTSDAASLGDALLAEGLLSGRKSSSGFFVDTVNGITADWEKDQTYWALYINGELANTYVDSTSILADATYHFTLTKG